MKRRTGGDGATPDWTAATVMGDFSFPWTEGVEAPGTLFRALWEVGEGGRFRFRFEVEDGDVVLGEGADAKAKVIGSDRAEIFFATGPGLNPYYCLEMDPRGEVLAYRARYHRQMEWEWECPELEVRAGRTAEGYEVEGSVAMETLRGLGCVHEDGKGYYLRAGVFRAEFSHRDDGGVAEDWMSWVHPGTAEPDFHVPGAFGILRLV